MPELAAQLSVRADLDLGDLFAGLAQEVLGVDLGDTTFDPGALLARVRDARPPALDGLRSSIGTMNFDTRSLALNDEVTLMVLDADVGVAWRRNSAMTCSGQRRSRRRASRNAPGGSGWARRWPSS